MKNDELKDLYNPEHLTGFLHTNGNYYVIGENQGIQAYYKDKAEKIISRIELWERLDDGRLMKLVGFRSRSIVATYTGAK